MRTRWSRSISSPITRDLQPPIIAVSIHTMNRTIWIFIVLLAAAAAAAVTGWRRVGQLRADSAALQDQLQALQQQSTAAASDQSSHQNVELENLRTQSQELLRFRNE